MCMYSITDSMDISLNKLRELVKDRGAWWAAFPGAAKRGHDLATEQQICILHCIGSINIPESYLK